MVVLLERRACIRTRCRGMALRWPAATRCVASSRRCAGRAMNPAATPCAAGQPSYQNTN